MKKLVYIKVYQGYIEARTRGKNNEKKFYSNGLVHPRTLAAKFSAVKALFKEAVSSQPRVLFGLIRPNLLIHLVPKMEGGYTETELQFFRDAARGVGASGVYLLDCRYDPQLDSELKPSKKWQ